MVSLSDLGFDHLSMVLLVGDAQNQGIDVELWKLRVNPTTHPNQGVYTVWSESDSTRLADGAVLSGHDDLDVIDDLVSLNILTNGKDGVALTTKGREIYYILLAKKRARGTIKGVTLNYE
jgi:hypothetical protein